MFPDYLSVSYDYVQSPQSSQSFEENFAISVALQDLVTNKRKKSDIILLSFLNIYSFRYKINDLKVLVSKVLQHYLITSETKINEEFPNLQFCIENYDIRNRKDRNKHGGGLIEFVRKGLIRKRLEVPKNVTSEIIASDNTEKNSKWTIVSAYRPPNNFRICNFLNDLSLISNKNLNIFDNIMLIGDFNNDFMNRKDSNIENLNDFWHRCFPVNFAKFLGAPFLKNTSGRLLL